MVENIRGEDLISVEAGDRNADAVLVAQADVPTLDPIAEAPLQVVVEVEAGSILRLPATASVDQPRVNGSDLQFVQVDGSVITVPNGAIQGLTIFIDNVEIPPQAVAALFEASGIETAAGPDASGARGSGGNFEVPVGGIGDAFDIGDLLDPTELTFADETNEDLVAANGSPIFGTGIFGLGAFGFSLSEEGLLDGLPDSNPEGADFSDSPTYTVDLGAFDPDGDPLTFTFGEPTSPFTSNGQVITWEGAGTDHLVGKAGDDVVFDIRIGGPSGTVNISLLQPVDHPLSGEDVVNLGLTVTANDGRGGTATATITIGLEDDSPEIGTPQNGIVDEDGLPKGIGDSAPGDDLGGNTGQEVRDESSYIGNLGIRWGADNYDATDGVNEDGSFAQDNVGRSVYFSEADLAAFQAAHGNLTSGGTALTFVLSANGTILTAVAGDGEGARDVFRISLSDDDTGSYKFQLLGQLDHASGPDKPVEEPFPVLLRIAGEPGNFEDDIELSFNFTARDSDGDTVGGSFTVTVDDDMPILVESRDYVGIRYVAENDIRTGLSHGTSPNDGNADGSYTGSPSANDRGPAFISGSLEGAVDFGADGFGHYAISDAVFDHFEVLGLTSKGAQLRYDTDMDGQWTTLTATAGGREVFEFRLNTATGEYEFRLFDQLDHIATSEVEGERTLLDTIQLDFGAIIRAYDGDGDHVDLEGKLAINIDDDAPLAPTGRLVFGIVEEEQLKGGNEDTRGPLDLDYDLRFLGKNYNVISTVASDNGLMSLKQLIIGGADDTGSFSLRDEAPGSAVLNTDGEPVLSGGKAVTIGETVVHGSDAGGAFTLLTGVAAGEPVFTIKIYADGDWRFQLLHQLDHLADNQEDVLALNLSSLVKYTDFDGDSVNLNGTSFVIKVLDDTPVIRDDHATRDIVVSEGGTGTATWDYGAGDNPSVRFGADGFGSSGFTGVVTFQIGQGTAGRVSLDLTDGPASSAKLTSGDQPIVFTANGNTIEGRVGDTLVIEVKIDGTKVTTTLHAPIDHVAPNGTALTDIRMDVGLVFKDGDGDAVYASIRTTIRDDVPTAGYSGTETIQEDRVDGAFYAEAAHGQLVFDAGADGGGITGVTLRTVHDVDNGTYSGALRSGGVTVETETVRDQSTGVITMTGTAGAITVFTLTIEADGAYTFHLLAPVDHPDLGQSGADDMLRVVFDFTVTDGDGDSTAWNNGTFHIDIRDDAPTADYSGTETIQEEFVDGAFHAATAGGQLVFNPGADGGVVTAVTLRTVHDVDDDQYAAGLVSNGVTVVTQTTTNAQGVITMTGMAGTVTVFTLTVQPGGAYTFQLLAPVDHPDIGQSGADDMLRVVFDFTVTDRDGDSTAWNNGTFHIDILDDVPTADYSGTDVVREDYANGAFHTDPAEGQLVFNPGADNGTVSAVQFRTAMDAASSEIFPPVTSNGVPVTTQSSTDSLGVITLTGMAGNVPVYTFNVRPDGAYSFQLLAPLDHAPGNSDTLRLVFDFIVTDQDGDSTPWKIGAVQFDIVDNPNTPPTILAPEQIGYATNDFLAPGPFQNVTYINRLVIADREQTEAPVTMRLALQHGTLEALSGSGVSVSGSGTKILTLTGTIAKINAFIAANSVEFDPDKGWPLTRLDDKLTVNVDDGAGGVATSVIAITHSTELRSDWSGWNLNEVGAYYGKGDDNVLSSWSHGPSPWPVTYDGGERLEWRGWSQGFKEVSNDKITLVFQSEQLAEILTDASDRKELDNFLTNPEHDLDLSGTAWNAIVRNFEDGKIALATGPSSHVVYEPSANGLADYRNSGTGSDGNDLLIASGNRSSLSGGRGDDILVGHDGNNLLEGGQGNDLLLGGAGHDVLSGGRGNDILSGGPGRDTFVFEHSGDANRDTITDYVLGEDEIDLTKLLEDSGVTAGNINDHVRLNDGGADAVLQVETGADWSDVAILSGHGNPGTAIDIRIDDHDFTIKVI